MLTPFPTQLTGALFLAETPKGILADKPRVGKTGAACIALDYVMAEKILVITTASGRAVWDRGLRSWSAFDRDPQILMGSISKLNPKKASAIVGWGGIANFNVRAQLLGRAWDAVVIDEGHYAKNFDSKRTQAVYGELIADGEGLDTRAAVAKAPFVWPLSGTLLPNSPFDAYTHLRALWPERLLAYDGMPDVTIRDTFMYHYCKVGMKKLSNFNKIPVIVGGKNEDELKHRIAGTFLSRTQADVGIKEPIYDIFPLLVSDRMRREFDDHVDRTTILEAAENGDTKALEMQLGPIRRHTGVVKATAIVEAVTDDFECGLDKIVLAYWHREVGDIIEAGLKKYGLLRLDGSTPANKRGAMEQEFLHNPKARVFLGQIQAAGEAIDLSSAASLMFVETSLVPKDMYQMALRITNFSQTRPALVRVATLRGSIDEALQEILMRKWTAIRAVMS